jgi:osmotically-inducible protein OsmY
MRSVTFRRLQFFHLSDRHANCSSVGKESNGEGITMKMLAEPETTLELEHQILERIAGRVRNLRVVRSEGRLILEGSSVSFHAKQLATHAALEFAPDDELINAITVERPNNFDYTSAAASRRY